jgi:hypothetical protein
VPTLDVRLLRVRLVLRPRLALRVQSVPSVLALSMLALPVLAVPMKELVRSVPEP